MTSRNRLTTIDSHNREEHHDHSHHEGEEDESELAIAFPVNIFDAAYCGEPVPAGFDTVRVVLDGTIKADLSWKKEREAASAYSAQGLRIFWEIDLGLPACLQKALGNRTQFLGLTLSLEHFCNSLWKEFRKETVGLCLYRGPVDFSLNYPWDEEQVLNLQEWISHLYASAEVFAEETGIEASSFASLDVERVVQSGVGNDLLKCFCRDAVGEYLSLLALRVPDSLPLFLLFDASGVQDPMLTAKLLSKERYPRFHVVHKSFDMATQVLGGEIAWNGTSMEKGMISRDGGGLVGVERATLGFCLPRMTLSRPSSTALLGSALEVLIARKMPFRVIPEVNLAAEWNGLDFLVVDTQHVEIQFKRRLQGFCAAGGTVVYIGVPLGLAQEVGLEEFLG